MNESTIGQTSGTKFLDVTLEFHEDDKGKISINVLPNRAEGTDTDQNKIALAALMVAGVQKSLQSILKVLENGRKAKNVKPLPRLQTSTEGENRG